MKKQERLEIAKKAIKMRQEQGLTWTKIAKKFNKTTETLRNYRKEYREYLEEQESQKQKDQDQDHNQDQEKSLIDEAIEETSAGAKPKSLKNDEKKPTTDQEKETKTEEKTTKKDKNNISNNNNWTYIAVGGCSLLAVLFIMYKIKNNKNASANEATEENPENINTSETANVDQYRAQY